MQSKYYRIGGLVWSLTGPEYEDTGHLGQFRCPPAPADHTVEIAVTDRLSVPDLPLLHRDDYVAHYSDGGRRVRTHDLEYTEELLLIDLEESVSRRHVTLSAAGLPYYNARLAQLVLDLPRQMPKFGGAFLHASYVSTDGGAILFTAPKQTGKSTQAELWRRCRGAEVVNGDRALVRKANGVWTAFGSPYCGTSDICLDVAAPIRAVVILGQGPENIARPASVREGLAALLDGLSYDAWDHSQVGAVMALAEDLICRIPIIRLDCRPDEGAVEALEEVLWKNERKR